MAVLSMRCLVFAFAMAMIFLVASSAVPDAGCCTEDKALVQLVSVAVMCEEYIYINNTMAATGTEEEEEELATGTEEEEPSTECCEVLRRSDLPCLCGNIPKAFEQYASLDRLIYAAGKCNPQFHSVVTCGSYTVGWSPSGAHAIANGGPGTTD